MSYRWLNRVRHPGQDAEHGQAAEHGAVAVVIPILTVGMLAMAGLVVDGGAALAARGYAADVAQQAARAGADALAPDSLRTSDPAGLAVNPAAAVLAADQVLQVGAVGGQVSVSGDTVTVTAQTTRPTSILSAIGIDTVTGQASATAAALYGGTTDPNTAQGG